MQGTSCATPNARCWWSGIDAHDSGPRRECGILHAALLNRDHHGCWVCYGPGSAAHQAVKNGALRCVRGTLIFHATGSVMWCDPAASITVTPLAAFAASTRSLTLRGLVSAGGGTVSPSNTYSRYVVA